MGQTVSNQAGQGLDKVQYQPQSQSVGQLTPRNTTVPGGNSYLQSKQQESSRSQQPTMNQKAPEQSMQKPAGKSGNIPKVAEKQPTGRDYGALSPTPTPANDYINKKKEASKDYQYGNQRHKLKAPYPTR